MKVTQEQVEKALTSLEAALTSDEMEVSKASEQDLDQPEGADLGNPVKEKLSDKAKSAKKGEGSEESEEHEAEESPAKEKKEEAFEKKACKSFAEEMPEEIQAKIDVSEFLKSLVEHTGDSLDALKDFVAKSDVAHEARYAELAETVNDIAKSQAKIGVVLKAVCQRIGVIAAAPARPAKSDQVSKSEGSERKFSSGLEAEGTDKMFKSLSDNPAIAKSQMSGALCDLVKKGEATDLDVIGFESGGYIRPELVAKLRSSLN